MISVFFGEALHFKVIDLDMLTLKYSIKAERLISVL